VIGTLDDLVIVPVGILIAVKLIPVDLMAEFRAEAIHRSKPASRAGLAIIISIWMLAAVALTWLFWPHRPDWLASLSSLITTSSCSIPFCPIGATTPTRAGVLATRSISVSLAVEHQPDPVKVGRVTASQIASASAASFFCRFR
jgi:hypothetical protein